MPFSDRPRVELQTKTLAFNFFAMGGRTAQSLGWERALEVSSASGLRRKWSADRQNGDAKASKWLNQAQGSGLARSLKIRIRKKSARCRTITEPPLLALRPFASRSSSLGTRRAARSR